MLVKKKFYCENNYCPMKKGVDRKVKESTKEIKCFMCGRRAQIKEDKEMLKD